MAIERSQRMDLQKHRKGFACTSFAEDSNIRFTLFKIHAFLEAYFIKDFSINYVLHIFFVDM